MPSSKIKELQTKTYKLEACLLRRLTADFSEWDSGVWAHYSQQPFIKINPKPFHADPAGVYLFPEQFTTKGNWEAYKYKFRVSVSGLNVLDLSKFNTPKKVIELVEKLKAVPKENAKGAGSTGEGSWNGWLAYRDDYIQKNGIKSAWDWLRGYFRVRPGAWSKAIRSAGYNAVFDDTGSIHIVEVQLLILDPSKIKIIEMVDQKQSVGSGYAEVLQVMDYLVKKVAPNYGKVDNIEKPKKQKSAMYGYPKEIKGSMRIISSKENYVWLNIYTTSDTTSGIVTGIHVSVDSSTPSLGYGSGGSWEFKSGKIEDIYSSSSRLSLKRDLDKIFEKELEPA